MSSRVSSIQSTSLSQCPPKTPRIGGRYRPTWAEVSVGAFAANLRAFRSLVGAGTRVMAVLKCDGYGHGAAALAPAAIQAGADAIGVSSIEEGLALREAGIHAPILLLGSVYPLENFAPVLEARLTPTVASLDAAQILAEVARITGKPASFHLKVDTGMGRLGVSPAGARAVLEYAAANKFLRVAGIYSHLASADSDAAFTARQLADLLALRGVARSLGITDALFHIANSAATIGHPDARLDMVRPGIALYGAAPVPAPAGFSVQPVLAWKTRVVFVKRVPAGATISYGRRFTTEREMDVATLPVGYGDGVPRAVFGKGQVLVKGERRRILGVVTMDHVMVDVTGAGVDVGEEAVLIGRQGAAEITAAEWASWAGTIPYEVFCGISKRVPRDVVA
jgi:alanine racemase